MLRLLPMMVIVWTMGSPAQLWAQLPRQPGERDTSFDEAASPADMDSTADLGSQQLSAQALQALVAGIAMYPDPVIEQVLAAAQTPQAIHEAAQSSPSAGQPGSQWPSSVQYLTQYPDLLKQLDAQLDWTAMLGVAARNQLADVWAAVDAVRAKIEAAANQASATDQAAATGADSGSETANGSVPSPSEGQAAAGNTTYYGDTYVAGGYYPYGWAAATAAVTRTLWTPYVYRELYHYDDFRGRYRNDDWYRHWRDEHVRRGDDIVRRDNFERRDNVERRDGLERREDRNVRDDLRDRDGLRRDSFQRDGLQEDRFQQENFQRDHFPRDGQRSAAAVASTARPSSVPGDARFRTLPSGEAGAGQIRAANQAMTEATRYHRGETARPGPVDGFGRPDAARGGNSRGFERPGGTLGPAIGTNPAFGPGHSRQQFDRVNPQRPGGPGNHGGRMQPHFSPQGNHQPGFNRSGPSPRTHSPVGPSHRGGHRGRR